MLRLNATTAFLCCRAALPQMRSMGRGRIINVAAHPALSGEGANMSAYSASKAAVWNLTQSLAREVGGTGITINAVLPSIIDTGANREAMPDADRSRWLAPADIARVMSWLASDEAAIVSGSALRLTG
jgi:NAD(P)-dependent dehydrogenase (short-subunit alcohol dehydrogenase family)